MPLLLLSLMLVPLLQTLIVIDVFAFTVIVGFSLGVLEAINYVVVIGLSIDYCVHSA